MAIRWRFLLFGVSALTVAIAGCADDDTTPATTTLPEHVWVLPRATAVPDSWTEVFTIPYGDNPDQLGTAPGGEGLELGPEYGALGPDGTWWFLDVAKQRVATFDRHGTYLGEVTLPPELLTQGIYVQFQLPRILADGTFVASGLRASSTELLVIRDGMPSTMELPGALVFRADDGRTLFGFDLAQHLVAADLDPNGTSGTVEEVEWFRTQRGERYRITPEESEIRLELPDAVPPVDRTFELHAPADIDGTVWPSVQVTTGMDGALHLLIVGYSYADDTTQLAGFVSITAEGRASPVEPMRDPFSPADPGSPAQLGIAAGSSTPWLMFVDDDGVRVYTRTAATPS